MSNLYEGLSIDTSYQVSGSFGLVVSEEKIKKNWPTRNKNCLKRSCLLPDRDEKSNLYRGLSIDASYQVSVHLAKQFLRRRLKCEKVKDDKWQTTYTKWWQKLTFPLARWAKKHLKDYKSRTYCLFQDLLYSLLHWLVQQETWGTVCS